MISPSAVKIAGPGRIASNRCARSGRASDFAGSFGGDDQDRRIVVSERDTRAQADQRSAEACAKAAQPLQPRSAALRERVRQARNLNGCRMIGVEAQQCSSVGRGRVKDRSTGRVSPKNAIGIALHSQTGAGASACTASRGSRRIETAESVRHRAVATITANEDLIGPPVMCVHASAGAIQRQRR